MSAASYGKTHAMKDQPIRVLHFMNSPEVPGGVEEHVYSLVSALPAERFNISIVCPSVSYKMFAPLAAPHQHVFSLDLYRFSQLGAMSQLLRILRHERIEIAHSHQFCATMFLAPLARASRVPWVVETPHVREAWRRGWLKQSFLVDRIVYTLVDRFIAVSRAGQAHLIERKHCDPAKITLIYNGRNLDRFQPNGQSGPQTRKKYGILPSDPLLVQIGRLEPQKGHHTLLQALLEVRQQIPQVRLLVIGEGSLLGSLQDDVKRQGLEGTVIFAGFLPDVRDLLEAADLVVMPSLWEGLPLVAIEAAAMGKAMVATAVDGIPEVVSDGQTGLLVPPNDPKALAAAIVELLRDGPKRKAMEATAKSTAQERFSLQQQVERTAELYESLARGTSVSRRLAGVATQTASDHRVVQRGHRLGSRWLI